MSRKAQFLMFVLVSIVANYFWDNSAESWKIFGHQAWAVFCTLGIHYIFRDKEIEA